MRKLLIKGGSLISPVNGFRGEQGDVLAVDGRIALIRDRIEEESREAEGAEVIHAEGCLVTPGLIDIHVHCYPKAFLGLDPDVLGIRRGCTTVLDAGSSGADTYEDFRENYIEKSRTKVFALLNVSREGLLRGHELDDPEKIDRRALKETLDRYGDGIVGLKARASASVVGEMGFAPIEMAAEIAHEVKRPLMVHVGNYPPALTQVLNVLDRGDVVTHAFHGKKGGILTEDGRIIPEAIQARDRGVLFDVGHGVASFSLRVFEKALKEGFDCDLISTDLHVENYEGPVYNLAAVLSKAIACGETLEDAVEKTTSAPARQFGLKELGELREGYIADFSIMELAPCDEEAVDAVGDSIHLEKKLVLKKTIYSRGEESEIFDHIAGK